MNVIINIIGEGSVVGAGQYSTGDEVSLFATPSTGAEFAYFQIDGEILNANPYVYTILSGSDISIIAVFVVTLEGYLRASVGFEIPDATLSKIRRDRGVDRYADVGEISDQIKELSYADCLMYGATIPSQIQKAKDSDNGWSHDAGSLSLSLADKRWMRKQAVAIYRKYSDKSYAPTVTLKPLNGSRQYADSQY